MGEVMLALEIERGLIMNNMHEIYAGKLSMTGDVEL